MELIRKRFDKNPDNNDALGLKLKYRYRPWNNDERGKFIEAVEKYGKNHSLISKHVGTKNL